MRERERERERERPGGSPPVGRRMTGGSWEKEVKTNRD